jgi:hypothetical protein
MKHDARFYVPATVPKPQSVIFCPVYILITLVYLSSELYYPLVSYPNPIFPTSHLMSATNFTAPVLTSSSSGAFTV